MLSLYFHIGLWPIFLPASLCLPFSLSLHPSPTLLPNLCYQSLPMPASVHFHPSSPPLMSGQHLPLVFYQFFLKTPLSSLSPPIPYPAFIFCSSNPPPLYVGAMQLPACCSISFHPHTLHGENIDWLVALGIYSPDLILESGLLSGSMCLPIKNGSHGVFPSSSQGVSRWSPPRTLSPEGSGESHWNWFIPA